MPAPVSDTPSDQRQRRTLVILLSIIAAILSVWVLRETRIVTMPLALAFFVAVLVHPIQRAVARRVSDRFNWLGVVAAMAVILVILTVFAAALWFAGVLLAERVPAYSEQAQQKWQEVQAWLASRGLATDGDDAAVEGLRDRVVEGLATWGQSFWQFLALLVLVFFFVLLMLLEVRRCRHKTETALDGKAKRGGDGDVVETVRVIAEKVRRYLLVKTIIGIIAGTLQGLYLWLVGVEPAYVWGLLFVVLNYIPNIGSIIAGLIPSVVALLTLGLGQALVAAGGLLIIDQVMGNYVDPWFQGRRLSISPLVVLVSIVFWGWVWGIPGAFLAVPMTATLMIVFAHVPALRPIAMLLSKTGDEDEVKRQTHVTGA